jgi:hypothetical protein
MQAFLIFFETLLTIARYGATLESFLRIPAALRYFDLDECPQTICMATAMIITPPLQAFVTTPLMYQLIPERWRPKERLRVCDRIAVWIPPLVTFWVAVVAVRGSAELF